MLLRNTLQQNKSFGNSWLADRNSDVPTGLVRWVQVSMYTDTDVWVSYVCCAEGKLILVLSCKTGVVASIDTNINNAFLNMDIKSDDCAGACVYTGAFVTDCDISFKEATAPRLACTAVSTVQHVNTEDSSAVNVNGEPSLVNTDVTLVVDSLYYEYQIDDNTLSITVPEDSYRVLSPAPVVSIDTTNPVYTINGVAPDDTGNIEINIVNTVSGATYTPVFSGGVFYINADVDFVEACSSVTKQDPISTDNNPRNVRTYDTYPLDCLFNEQGVRDMTVLNEMLFELTSTPGISLYTVNDIHDKQDNAMDICI